MGQNVSSQSCKVICSEQFRAGFEAGRRAVLSSVEIGFKRRTCALVIDERLGRDTKNVMCAFSSSMLLEAQFLDGS